MRGSINVGARRAPQLNSTALVALRLFLAMFTFAHLTQKTRGLMLAEFVDDLDSGILYLSDRLSPAGRDAYPHLLRQAIEAHDLSWLIAQLSRPGMFNATFRRRKPTGGTATVTMPADAPATLSEGEYNRFYCRALCLRAIEECGDRITLVRGKAVHDPRPDSEVRIGTTLTASAVLADLRSNIGLDTIFGVPAGPNSGLSLSLPEP
jgi:hypothetical protein